MKKLLALLLIAFLLRLVALNQSLWLDEAVVVNSVARFSYLELLTKFAPGDFHPPLYYWLIKAWVGIFGNSEMALRMPSILFSLGTGAILYSLAGFWPAVFILFNPLFVYYSQESRMYSMVTFFLTLGYFAIRKNNLWLFLAAIILSLFTFYGAIFLIACYLLFFLWQKKWHWFWFSGAALFCSLLILSPLLSQQLANSVIARELVVNWQSVLGTASLKNLLLIPLKFATGRISFYPKVFYYLMAGLSALLVWLNVFKAGLNKTNTREVLFLVGPLVLGFLTSFITPLLSYFRFLYVLPFMAILLDKGSSRAWAKYLVLGVFLVWSGVYLFLPQFHREDWRSLSSSLPHRAAVYGIPSSLEGVRYYRPDVDIRDIREDIYDRKIWVIPYTFEIYGLSSQLLLKPLGLDLVKKQEARNLTLEYWK